LSKSLPSYKLTAVLGSYVCHITTEGGSPAGWGLPLERLVRAVLWRGKSWEWELNPAVRAAP